MEWEQRFLSNEGRLRNLEAQLGIDNFQLLITGSYGDIFPNLALLNAFHHVNKKMITVLVGEHWKLLADRFSNDFTKFFFINGAEQNWLHTLLCSQGRPLVRDVGYLFPTLPTLHPWVADFILTERVSDYEAKRALLGLPIGAQMELLPLKEVRSAEISDALGNLGAEKSNGVLLSFHSNSNPMVDLESQLVIARFFVERGRRVVYNVSGSRVDGIFLNQLSELGVALFDVPCDATIEVVEYLGAYVGSAHGLTAILSSFPCTAQIIQVVPPPGSLIVNNNRLITTDSLRVDKALRSDLLNDVHIIQLGSHLETQLLAATT